MRDALTAYLSAGDPREERAADSAFHRSICDATHNPQIAMLSRDLLARASLGFPVEPWGKGERTHFHRGSEDHKALYEAVAAGEPEQAEKIARAHFTISADMIRDVLARVRNAGQS
jgi:DNA-binding FadR family transcriptional regulator